tara:strand:- start:20605 stop:20778 length:174 start_codon:yes stop_codon:yes gene_type:complete
MNVGDIIEYIHHSTPRRGIVIKIIDKFKRDDNILAMWDCGRCWCVESGWVRVVNDYS